MSIKHKKKAYRFLSSLAFKLITVAVVIIVLVVSYFSLIAAGAKEEIENNPFLAFIFDKGALSAMVVVLLGYLLILILRWYRRTLEDSDKTSDDHHSIIHRYGAHVDKEYSHPILPGENYYDELGSTMYITSIFDGSKPKPYSKIKDKFSKEQKNFDEDVEKYTLGKRVNDEDDPKDKTAKRWSKRLELPTICVFANLAKEDFPLVFSDSLEGDHVSEFITNDVSLYGAHSFSEISNNETIRLVDVHYDCPTGKLIFVTGRTNYFHMLISNRCMDYDMGDKITLRDLFEFKHAISPLDSSKLSNQIGINGLVFTNDDYVLLEKRGGKKSTWKHKISQPISLSMRADKLNLVDDNNEFVDKIGPSEGDAEKCLSHIVRHTLRDNFGIPCSEIDFSLKENFLGLARDLLEGGKPNLYFSVKLNKSATELKKEIEDASKLNHIENAGGKDNKRVPLEKEKLRSSFFLVPYSNIQIDFKYRMHLTNKKDCIIVKRAWPRRINLFRRMVSNCYCIGNKRECSEALLASLSFMELRNPKNDK